MSAPFPDRETLLTDAVTPGVGAMVSEIWFRFFERLSKPDRPLNTQTVGAQTIDYRAGSFQVAAGSTSVLITNRYVKDSNTVVNAWSGTNDPTWRIISVVPTTSSFIVTYTAPAAQSRIFFQVIAP